MLITNGQIHTISGPVFSPGYVRVESGLITGAGPMSELPKDALGEKFDADGAFVLPGLIDAHCHIGVFEEDVGSPGDDTNEESDPVTPHLRVLDAVNPQDRAFEEALSAGVTAVCVSPGSANPIGGQILTMSTHGICADEMVLRDLTAMKFALGENPKTPFGGRQKALTTRMAVSARIRESLFAAGEYMRLRDASSKKGVDTPKYDMKMEALLPVIERKSQAHFHAHRLDDIFTAVRIAKEFCLDLTIIHGTEAHLSAGTLAALGVRIVTGPTLLARSKAELRNLSYAAAGILSRAGIVTAISTDHPEIPSKHLGLAAAFAVRDGMDEKEALKAITLNAAICSGISNIAGSLEKGKRADIAVFDRSPLDLHARAAAVFVGGERVR